MSEETKRCPKCNQKDVTSFSSCRYCGTKYDTVIAEQPKAHSEKTIVVLSGVTIAVIGLLIIGYMFFDAVKTQSNPATRHVDWAAEDLKKMAEMNRLDRKRLGDSPGSTGK